MTKRRMTVKQEDFARLVGYEGYTQIDAYREVYKPRTKSIPALTSMAYRLTVHPSVAQAISKYRDQIGRAHV